MSKVFKLGFSIFVGLDIFVISYLGLAQLRFMIFGSGAIPGGGSALDMALFLIPLFVGYLAGDRLFHFLTYNPRKQLPVFKPEITLQASLQPSIWEEKGWDDGEEDHLESPDLARSSSVLSRPENQK